MSSAENKLRRNVSIALKQTGASIPWGEYNHLVNADISSLSNEKLKRHLRARNEVAEGTKSELVERLQHSIDEEHQKNIAIELELEAKHRKIAILEEQGAVYACGKNNFGQLGLNDEQDRHIFTVIPSTRGKHVQHVSAGGNIALATTRSHEVYSWGYRLGPTGLHSNQKAMYNTPQRVEKLNEEEIIMTAIGASHACAVSEGNDLFIWGLTNVNTQTPLPQYMDAITCSEIHCGEMHTCLKTKEGSICTFGHGANGKLGRDGENQALPMPVPTKEKVNLLACGAEHTIFSSLSSVYSFGCGDGGRLGLGDMKDRIEPCEITTLRGAHTLSLSAGTWHSSAVVHVSPLVDSGWLYTWGSGFVGQLGIDKICKTSTPTLVKDFVHKGLSVKKIFCGSHHNAAITNDGNLYTWGANQHGALGRSIDLPFTANPGLVATFGTIVDRIGCGLPLSVACGREYTLVATHPYKGPSEVEALKLADEERIREEEEEKKRQTRAQEEEEELKHREQIESERIKIQYLTSKRLCSMDPKCPGFTYESTQPSLCRECGFSVVYHTIVDNDNVCDEGKSS